MNDAPVGIFDSGIGGLTLANAIRDTLPNENLFYFGDTAHLPYGDKSTAAIQAYSVKICNVLLAQHCKVIVIACYSASSAAYDLVKEYVGSRALVVNVIDPVVAHIQEHFDHVKLGLIGTRRTVSSNVYKAKVDALGKQINLASLATPLLAPMIEEGFYNNKISKDVIAQYLQDSTLDDITGLVLACTHYPLIKQQISDYYEGKVDVIDPSEIVAHHLKAQLHDASMLRTSETPPAHRFYVSDVTTSFRNSTRLFFGEKVDLQHYKLWE